MAHWALTNAEGDVQFVQSLSGIDIDVWVAKKLSREPTEHDHYVDGKLKHDKDLKNKIDENSRLNAMTSAESHHALKNDLIQRMVAAGVITSDEAALI